MRGRFRPYMIEMHIVGGRGRDRPGDPLLAKQMLSQLSYTPAAVAHCEADPLVGSSRACCIGNLERNEPVRRAPMSHSFLDKLLH